jgi:predicted GNAT family acetyltransferase
VETSTACPVATGFDFHTGDHVGVFGMGTLEQHRGRGYGAAVAARIITDGMAAGATRSFLQSSELGYHVYQRLGYRQVESWTVWA